MKTITLTSNEVLTLIAEGMTMYNCQSLANKLRNADASVASSDSNLRIVQAKAKAKARTRNAAMVNLEKAKQTETTLRQQIHDLENEAKLDAESLKYFRKWVEELRVAMGYGKGVTPATMFSNSIELVKQHNELCKRAADQEYKLVKANDVISAVKTAYDHEGWTQHKAICEIADTVEGYYRGD